MRYILPFSILILFAHSSFGHPTSERGDNEDGRPNIVVLLSDDMGYSDVGSYGGEIDTPTLDRLARSGEPIQHGNLPEYMLGPPDTYQSYARPWANVSNTPFREYKHLVHEGGIATPAHCALTSGHSAGGRI